MKTSHKRQPRVKKNIGYEFDSDGKLRFFATAKFKKLNAKWHAKLERSVFKDGETFEDSEDFTSKNEFMREWHDMHFSKPKIADQIEAKQRYYELARELVHTYQFESPVDKTIWELYSEGGAEKKIAKQVKKTHTYVQKLVRRLKPLILRDAKTILEEYRDDRQKLGHTDEDET